MAKLQHSPISKVTEHEVTARKLNSILEEASDPLVIDFLSLDVEGVESTVSSVVAYQKYRFKSIIIESRNRLKTKKHLESFGYELTKAVFPSDILFKHAKVLKYSKD